MAHQANSPRIRRIAKDSVFCDLFSQPDYLLELYRMLHPEDTETTEADLEIVTIERVITEGEYNDLGFTVGGRLLVLVEAQSTWSVNIVTRMLLYLAETYRRHLRQTGASLHDTAAVRLPTPELYVVYTGPRNVPDTVTLTGDILDDPTSDIEVRVHVLRGDAGGVLGQYAKFAELVDEVRLDDALAPRDKPAEVVRRCVEGGILTGYMERRWLEVEDIMFTLFDQEYETELYHKRMEKRIEEQVKERLAAEVAEQIAAEVTEKVTAEVTERVTTEVTERVTAEVTGRVTAENVSRLARTQGLDIEQAMEILAVPAGERAGVAELAKRGLRA